MEQQTKGIVQNSDLSPEISSQSNNVIMPISGRKKKAKSKKRSTSSGDLVDESDTLLTLKAKDVSILVQKKTGEEDDTDQDGPSETFLKLLESTPDIQLFTEIINRTVVASVEDEADLSTSRPNDLDEKGYSAELNVYFCTDCSYTFSKENMYKGHQRDGACVFDCQFCDQVFYFRNYSKYELHLRNHKLEEEKSRHKDKVEFERHFKVKGKRYTCSKCQRSFSNYANLRRHTEAHTAKLRCHCGATFMSREYLRYHQKGAHEKGYSCDLCPEDQPSLFRTRTSLFSHKNKEHSIKFKCDECGFKFGQRHHLEDHMLAKHRKTGPRAQCIHCGVVFKQARSLTRHLREQTCTVAKKRGRKPKKTLDEPKVCEDCGKMFPYHRALTQHRQTHNKAPVNKCVDCGAVFKHRQSLCRHRRNMRCVHSQATKRDTSQSTNGINKKARKVAAKMNNNAGNIQELVFVEFQQSGMEDPGIVYHEVEVVDSDIVKLEGPTDQVNTEIISSSDNVSKPRLSEHKIDNAMPQSFDCTTTDVKNVVDSNIIRNLDQGAVFTISGSVNDKEFPTIKDSEGRTYRLVGKNLGPIGNVADKNAANQSKINVSDIVNEPSGITDCVLETEKVIVQINESTLSNQPFSFVSSAISNVYLNESQSKMENVNLSMNCRLDDGNSSKNSVKDFNSTFQSQTSSTLNITPVTTVPTFVSSEDSNVYTEEIVVSSDLPYCITDTACSNTSHSGKITDTGNSDIEVIHIGQIESDVPHSYTYIL